MSAGDYIHEITFYLLTEKRGVYLSERKTCGTEAHPDVLHNVKYIQIYINI